MTAKIPSSFQIQVITLQKSILKQQMKKHHLIITLIFCLAAGATYCQDIAPSDLPSNILNDFNQNFPQAMDVEWEMDGELYNVEFELSDKKDHDIWYNQAGEMVKHKQEIDEADLPEQIRSKISSEYSGYTIDDAKQIIENNVTTYSIELDSSAEELELTLNSNGEIIDKKAD